MIPLIKKQADGTYSRPNAFHIVFLWTLSLILMMEFNKK